MLLQRIKSSRCRIYRFRREFFVYSKRLTTFILFLCLYIGLHPSIYLALHKYFLRSQQKLLFIQKVFFSCAFWHLVFNNVQISILKQYLMNSQQQRIPYQIQTMKNQPKIIRERKQSLNKAPIETSARFEYTDHRDSKTRSSSSLPKKIVKTSNSIKKTEYYHDSYLLAWGNLPISHSGLAIQFTEPTKISRNVVKYSTGEKHIIYLNSKQQAYGIGISEFGQLGCSSKDQTFQTTSIPILQQCLIQQVFATPYCTFLITNHDEIYGCGLNNRGQLGNGSTNNVITPTKIHALSKESCLKEGLANSYRKCRLSESKSKDTKKGNRIKSVVLAQRCITNQSNIITEQFQRQDNTDSLSAGNSLLKEGQFIVSIEGGPFHTLVLTNKGRVFYTGNIYKKSTIVNDQFASKFSELNLNKIGRVQKIKAGLTSIGLLSIQGSLYFLGALSQNIVCDEPYNSGISCVVDFVISKDKISIINSLGQLYFLNYNRKALKTIVLQDKMKYGKFKQIMGGFDVILLKNEKNCVFAQESNIPSCFKGNYQDCTNNQNRTNEKDLISLKCIVETQYNFTINVNGSFFAGLFDKPTIIHQIALHKKKKAVQQDCSSINAPNKTEMMKKIQDLMKQNQALKDLLRKESDESIARQPSMKSIKNSEISECRTANKFQISNKKVSQKARTFQSSLQIPFQQLQLGKQISEGGYGIIYKAIWRKTTVAVKIFKVDENNENSIKDFISQCHAMEALRHPNIVMFLGACTKPPTFAIVLQYCQGGTLWSILQRNGQLNWNIRKKFALDMAKGMNYLHQRPTPILHRDLKSLNILLDANKQIKLADFGWTKGLQNYMTGKIGTYQWMAPEVVSSHQYTEKADVFSFGIILWEIASREAPYRNIPGAQVAQDVLHKDLRPIIPKKTPSQFASLITKCWSKIASDRPSFIQIIETLDKMQFFQ